MPRWLSKRVLLGVGGAVLIVATFAYLLPTIADYRDVWGVVKSVSWEWALALVAVTAINILTFAPPWVVLLPGLRFWTALMMTQAFACAEFGLTLGILSLVFWFSPPAQDSDFWKSMFRYNSGSGPAVMTGWANVLFPYFQDADGKLYKNPYLKDWKDRLAIDDQQGWRDRWQNPQGVGIGAVPACLTSVPLTVFWGSTETQMRLVGGLMGVTQNIETLAVEPECGWAVIYEQPIDSPAAENPEPRMVEP
jgi:hypothetical protein